VNELSQVMPTKSFGESPTEHSPEVARLRQRVREEIENVAGKLLSDEDAPEKAAVRKAHLVQRNQILIESSDFISAKEEVLLEHFASGSEIDPSLIDPFIVPARTPFDNDLFRYASLQWSVPVSAGYGRRNKFLVKDRQNNKLIGIFALGDPVINLGPRDQTIGWTAEDRRFRLYNVLDAFVLGAVGPYRELLGGKLVALAAISNETRAFIYNKYVGRQTGISKTYKDPTPVLVTTTSSLGKSSIYNRLTFNGKIMFHPVGYSAGYGHFQFSEKLFKDLTDFVRLSESDQKKVGNSFGAGANWRFRLLSTALKKLDLPLNMLKHGVGREVYMAPLAENWDAFLRGETKELRTFDLPLSAISEYYRNRWAVPRAQRRPEYKDISREVSRISPLVPKSHMTIQQALLFKEAAEGKNVNEPCIVKLGAYQIEVGIASNEVEGQSVSGIFGKGNAYFSRLTGPSMELILSDTTWISGERDIQAVRRNDSDELFDQLVNRLRISVNPTEKYPHLSLMEMRLATPHSDGSRATAKKFTREEVKAVIGKDIFPLLASIRGVIPGTRESLLKDNSRRRTELAVVFNSNDRVAPLVVWALTRAIALLKFTDPDGPVPGNYQKDGVTPENPEERMML
jgi:Domain of unknown function (DUF4338)